ncbi:MAG: helix-turn-helix domain-containing protein [Sciscionella sp.]
MLAGNDSPRMALRWRSTVNKDRGVKGSAHHLALYLSCMFRPNGTGYATDEQLACDMGVSKDTIQRSKERLIKLGYLAVVKRGWRGHHTDYTFALPKDRQGTRPQSAVYSDSATEIGRTVPTDRPQIPALTDTYTGGTERLPLAPSGRLAESSDAESESLSADEAAIPVEDEETALPPCKGCGKSKPYLSQSGHCGMCRVVCPDCGAKHTGNLVGKCMSCVDKARAEKAAS